MGKFVTTLRNWSEVTRTVRKVHAESGHFGRDPTLIELKKHVWWFGNTAEDVTEVLRGRPQCQVHSTHNPTEIAPPPQHAGYRKEALGLVAADLKRLPETPDSNKHVLVLVDYFAKYARARVLKTKSADEVVAAIMDALWREHGAPTAAPPDDGIQKCPL